MNQSVKVESKESKWGRNETEKLLFHKGMRRNKVNNEGQSRQCKKEQAMITEAKWNKKQQTVEENWVQVIITAMATIKQN